MCEWLPKKLKIELYVHKIYRVSLVLFLASGVFVCLFVLGLRFTRDRHEPTSDTPYFFPAMVCGSFCFLECLVTLVMCIEGRIMLRHGQCVGKGEKARSRYTIWDNIYFFLKAFGLLFGFIGTIITAYGFCTRGNENCYYDVNWAENRAITGAAMFAQIVFMLGQLYLLFWVKVEISPLRKTGSSRVTPTPRPPPKKPTAGIRQLKLVDSDSSSDEGKVQSKKQVKPLPKKRTSLFLLDSNALKSGGQSDAVTRLNRLHVDLPTNTRRQTTKSGSTSAHVDPQPKLPAISGDMSRDENAGAVKSHGFGHDLPPPPSYDDAMGTSRVKRKPSDLGPNPYHLPPLPGYDAAVHQAPGNIYTHGTSYPDGDLIAIQPKSNH